MMRIEMPHSSLGSAFASCGRDVGFDTPHLEPSFLLNYYVLLYGPILFLFCFVFLVCLAFGQIDGLAVLGKFENSCAVLI